MRNKPVTRGAIFGIPCAIVAIMVSHQPSVAELPFGWQPVICTAFGALTGLVIGLVYRWFSSRTQNQQQ